MYTRCRGTCQSGLGDGSCARIIDVLGSSLEELGGFESLRGCRGTWGLRTCRSRRNEGVLGDRRTSWYLGVVVLDASSWYLAKFFEKILDFPGMVLRVSFLPIQNQARQKGPGWAAARASGRRWPWQERARGGRRRRCGGGRRRGRRQRQQGMTDDATSAGGGGAAGERPETRREGRGERGAAREKDRAQGSPGSMRSREGRGRLAAAGNEGMRSGEGSEGRCWA